MLDWSVFFSSFQQTGGPAVANAISVNDIYKSFGTVEALRGVSLEVAEAEKVVVIGPSGSGKSVLIRCINGLEVPDSGTIVVDGMNLSDRKVNARAVARDVAMVFQSYNLYPHKTVLENVTLAPIKVLKVPREQAEREGRAYLDRVGLADKVDKYPDQLSGGQQQRVAIARALNMHPEDHAFGRAHERARPGDGAGGARRHQVARGNEHDHRHGRPTRWAWRARRPTRWCSWRTAWWWMPARPTTSSTRPTMPASRASLSKIL